MASPHPCPGRSWPAACGRLVHPPRLPLRESEPHLMGTGDIPLFVVVLVHVSDFRDRTERSFQALAQLYAQRVLAEELLRPNADHPPIEFGPGESSYVTDSRF